MEGLSQVPQNGQNGQQVDPQEAEAKRVQEETMRRDLIATVLDTAARERRTYGSTYQMPVVLKRYPVSRISLVSPERSKQIETILIRMAQSGQLRGRVSENQLIELLEQVCITVSTHLLAY